MLMSGLIIGNLYGLSAGAVLAQEVLPEYTLEAVNVTASGYEKSNLDTPADISVFTGAELEKTGASNVADALKYKGGIYFTQMGPSGQNWITNSSKATLRGVDNGTLILVNGVPASFNGVSHLDNIDLSQVEKVEVVKGGGAVLYGSEAFGGVINVIMKENYKNSIHVAAGDKGQRDYSVAVNAGKLNVFAGHKEYGATDNLSVNLASNSSAFGANTKYLISFGKSKKENFGMNYLFNDNVKFSYNYNKKDYSMNYNGVQGTMGLLQHFDYDDEEHYAQLAYNNKEFEATAYYNQRDIDNPDYRFVNAQKQHEWEESKQRVYGLNVKQSFGSASDKFLVGAGYKHEIWSDEREKFANATGAVNYKNDSYNSNTYSIYGQYDKKLSKATNFLISARQEFADFNGEHYNEFLPQAQIITRVDKENSVYMSAGKSFRMPNFRNLFYSSGMIRPNPDLKPEKGTNYEVGYKFETEGAKLNVAVFRTDVEDQIVSLSLGNNVSTPTNVSEFKNTGVEMRYDRDLTEHLSYNLGAVFSKPQRRYASGQDWTDALGRYQLNGGINYHNRDIEAALSFSYWGDRVTNSMRNGAITATKISSPLLVSNLHFGYKIKENMKVTLNVDNLFNRKDICNVDTSSSQYYTQGRSFLLGLDYNF